MQSSILLVISTLTPTVAHSKFLQAISTFLYLLLLLLLLLFPNRFCILIDCLAYSIVGSSPLLTAYLPFTYVYLVLAILQPYPPASPTHTLRESRVCWAYEACDCFTYSLLITWRRCWGLSPAAPLLFVVVVLSCSDRI